VDVWKLRRGTMVKYDYEFTYITDIGSIDLIDNNYVARIFVENMGLVYSDYSDSMEWLEPH
jgi:hypothetical protein